MLGFVVPEWPWKLSNPDILSRYISRSPLQKLEPSIRSTFEIVVAPRGRHVSACNIYDVVGQILVSVG
jgi:hypothetical protein